MQAVVAGHAGRLVGQARAVQCGEQHVAGAVAGEDAPGTVAAVRGRGEAEDGQPRVGRAEAGDRAAPVLLVAERGPFPLEVGTKRVVLDPPVDLLRNDMMGIFQQTNGHCGIASSYGGRSDAVLRI